MKNEPEMRLHYRMYKKGKRWLFAGIGVFSLAGTISFGGQNIHAATTDTAPVQTQTTTAPQATESIDTWMPDKNLQLAVLKAMQQNSIDVPQILPSTATVNDITKDKMALLKTLLADSYNISSIEGLQYATNLTELNLYPNGNAGHSVGLISDLTPLTNLSQLQIVALNQNNISDITPLMNKPKLTQLGLAYNHITDISPLSTSPNLTKNSTGLMFQQVTLPLLGINGEDTSFTSPSTVVKGISGQQENLVAYDGQGQFGDFPYVSNATGTVAGNKITWTNFTPGTNGVGYLTTYWEDPYPFGNGWLYNGWIIQPYVMGQYDHVTINYQTPDGKELFPDTIISGPIGTAYDVNKNSDVINKVAQLIQSGYEMVGLEGTLQGTIGTDDGTVTLVYAQKVQLPIHIVDEKSNELLPPQSLNGHETQPFTIVPPTESDNEIFKNYTFLKATDAAGNEVSLTGTMSLTSEPIYLIYGPAEKSIQLHYVDDEGNPIVFPAGTPASVTGKYGEDWSLTPADLPRYEFDKSVDMDGNSVDMNGRFTTDNPDITLVYHEVKGTTSTETPANLTIKYVDENGNEIKVSDTKAGFVGNDYSIAAPEIEDYELVGPSSASGKLLDGENVVTFVYKKISVTTPTETPANLTIKYVDENGNEIKVSDTKAGFVGNDYSIAAPEIEDYELVGPSSASGKLLDGENVVTFVYKKISVTTPTDPETPPTTPPTTPEDPTPPINPVVPEIPAKPDQPNIPSQVVDDGNSSEEIMESDKDMLPQTNEQHNKITTILGLVFVGAGLLTLGFIEKRRTNRNKV